MSSWKMQFLMVVAYLLAGVKALQSGRCMEDACRAGECIQTTPDTFACNCPIENYGDLCEFAFPVCGNCSDHGRCAIVGEHPALRTECICDPGYEGPECAELNEKARRCFENGHVVGSSARSDNFTCDCIDGFSGVFCEDADISLLFGCKDATFCRAVYNNGVCDQLCNSPECLMDGMDCPDAASTTNPFCPNCAAIHGQKEEEVGGGQSIGNIVIYAVVGLVVVLLLVMIVVKRLPPRPRVSTISTTPWNPPFMGNLHGILKKPSAQIPVDDSSTLSEADSDYGNRRLCSSYYSAGSAPSNNTLPPRPSPYSSYRSERFHPYPTHREYQQHHPQHHQQYHPQPDQYQRNLQQHDLHYQHSLRSQQHIPACQMEFQRRPSCNYQARRTEHVVDLKENYVHEQAASATEPIQFRDEQFKEFVHQPNAFGRYPIHELAANPIKDPAIVHRDYHLLVTNGTNLNQPDRDGNTPLALAVISGRLGMVRMILKSPNTDVLQANMYGKNPLHLAAEKPDVAMVKELLQDERFVQNINACDGKNRTALMLAIEYLQYEIVSLLLNHKADPDYPGDLHFQTDERADRAPLHWAAEHAGTDIIDLLIHHHANVNARDFALRTPLHLAAMAGKLDVVKRLFECQAYTNCRDDNDKTALDYAIAKDHRDIVEFLKKHHRNEHIERRQRNRKEEKKRSEEKKRKAAAAAKRESTDTGYASSPGRASEERQLFEDEHLGQFDENFIDNQNIQDYRSLYQL